MGLVTGKEAAMTFLLEKGNVLMALAAKMTGNKHLKQVSSEPLTLSLRESSKPAAGAPRNLEPKFPTVQAQPSPAAPEALQVETVSCGLVNSPGGQYAATTSEPLLLGNLNNSINSSCL